MNKFPQVDLKFLRKLKCLRTHINVLGTNNIYLGDYNFSAHMYKYFRTQDIFPRTLFICGEYFLDRTAIFEKPDNTWLFSSFSFSHARISIGRLTSHHSPHLPSRHGTPPRHITLRSWRSLWLCPPRWTRCHDLHSKFLPCIRHKYPPTSKSFFLSYFHPD